MESPRGFTSTAKSRVHPNLKVSIFDPESAEVEKWKIKQREAVPHPVAVFNARASRLEDIVKIVSADGRELQTPNRQPIDDEARQGLYRAPEDYLIAPSGLVYPINNPPHYYEGEAYEKFKNEAPRQLRDQIVQNQRNTSFETCEARRQLESRLGGLMGEARERGQSVREEHVAMIGKLGYRSASHIELETADGESIWVDTGVMSQGNDQKWRENQIWHAVTQPKTTPRGLPVAERIPEISVPWIITVDECWQLAEEVSSEGEPTSRFWVRTRPGCQLPPRFEEQTGLWGMVNASRRPYRPEALPANEYVVRKLVEKLESALSTSPS